MEINGKEIVFKPYTRGIDKQVSEKMLEGVDLTVSWGEEEMKVPATNAGKAEELMVCLMTGITREELDELPVAEYQKIVEECNKVKEGKKK